MKFVLSSGKDVKLGVSHKHYDLNPLEGEDTLPWDFWASHNISHARGTEVWLTLDGKEIRVKSICKPPDGFCKAKGRRLAANRLLQLLSTGYDVSKEDRRTIFFKICPEYPQSKRRRKSISG